MRSRAVRVPRVRGEQVRQRLREAGLLRRDLEVGHEGDWLVFPIAEVGEVPEGLGQTVDGEFAPASTKGAQDYRELLDWSDEEKDVLPRSFDVVGDIVLVRLSPRSERRGPEIAAALLEFVPGARLVGQDRGVEGPDRRRRVERLAGGGPWTTRHRENGLELEVDLERAYFSPRLAREHARVADEVRAGDRVYDLCCGVGPFAVTIARDGRAERVVAVDANPVAVDCLRATLARYPFGRTVEPVEDRVERFSLIRPPVERVIFNLPHEGIKYLPSVGSLVSRAGRLFYYEVAAREALEQRSESILETLGGSTRWRLSDRHVVHPYSPTADLVAFTLERAPL
jgi:tRNA (guanine37-N1)-methyltransferase